MRLFIIVCFSVCLFSCRKKVDYSAQIIMYSNGQMVPENECVTETVTGYEGVPLNTMQVVDGDLVMIKFRQEEINGVIISVK